MHTSAVECAVTNTFFEAYITSLSIYLNC
jgi:hypothetical protein